MTTPLGPVRRDIPTLHAAIAGSSTLQRERRAVYQLATELLQDGCPLALDLDVIDSPLARNRIGDALAGGAGIGCSALVGISAVADEASRAHDLWVVSRPEANTLLATALDTIEAELCRRQAAFGSPRLLTDADGERFTSALAVLRDGVALARSVNADLIDDLLIHVALVGVIDPQRAGRLASASPRNFPGLVLMAGSRSPIEAAEALLHEGAHQKFFDLAIAHDLLSANSDRCPPFHPPWAQKGRLWPLEQSLAAYHAYTCLAQFAQDASESTWGVAEFGADSLFPVASKRSEILGEWLLRQGDYLGVDAHTLMDGLIGRRPRTSHPTETPSRSLATDYVIDPELTLRRCDSSDRVLVGRPSRPPQFYWVSDDAATVLEVLAQRSLDASLNQVVNTLAQRWHLHPTNATRRLTILLSDLYVAGLVKIRNTAGGNP